MSFAQHTFSNPVTDSRFRSQVFALAVRFDCPIYTYEFILEQAGIILEESVREQKNKSDKAGGSSLKQLSVDKLNHMLQVAIDKEDYEEAAKLRDEINKRVWLLNC